MFTSSTNLRVRGYASGLLSPAALLEVHLNILQECSFVGPRGHIIRSTDVEAF